MWELFVVPFEFQMLGLSVALGFIHVIAASHSASLQRGYRWTASARDEPLPPLIGMAGRLARALTNFCETFPFFAALAVAVVVGGKGFCSSRFFAPESRGTAGSLIPVESVCNNIRRPSVTFLHARSGASRPSSQ
jgi:hypothetical protein